MSLTTWCNEFYPVPADDVSVQNAVAHSLQKWKGLRPENLEKHGLIRYGDREIREVESPPLRSYVPSLAIDADSCALCYHFLRDEDTDEFDDDGDVVCSRCPLHQTLGHDCDHAGGPYDLWLGRIKDVNRQRVIYNHASSTPEPMIAALEKTLANQQKESDPCEPG